MSHPHGSSKHSLVEAQNLYRDQYECLQGVQQVYIIAFFAEFLLPEDCSFTEMFLT